MTIVAGTDFSENARHAARAAAAVARRLQVPLKLVHVIEDLGVEDGGQGSIIQAGRRAALANHARELRDSHGIEVEPITLVGDAERSLVAFADQVKAQLLLVSSLGANKPAGWLVGSVAERVAQLARVPVMVVRDSSCIEAWAKGERALRVMVGVELTTASRPALRFAERLRTIGRCDVVVAQVVWPFGEHLRLGVPMPIPIDQLRPELHEPLLRDLRTWAGQLGGDGDTSVVVSPGWSRVDSHLAALAAEQRVDLLIVGSHRRSAVARLWQGSVSRGVLHQASCNVACVPKDDGVIDERDVPSFRRVLVSTDFSPLANRAIPVAFGLVAPGGVMHLLHVVTGAGVDDEQDARGRLRALIPPSAAAHGVVTEIEVVKDRDAAVAIAQAAARLGVDGICMATHGRSGTSQLALGSQAQEVVRRARQPVLLVPPERDGGERTL